MGIDGRKVDSLFRETPEPGDFAYFTNSVDEFDVIAGVVFCCPCGCGVVGTLKFGEDHNPHWSWDGNVQVPTLNPSIVNTQCNWHGWLKKGIWISV